MHAPPTSPHRRGAIVGCAVAGAALAIAGFAALASIPRGPAEFAYLSADTLAPLPFAALNGFTPEQLSSHVARLLLLAPATLLLGWAAGPLVVRLGTRLLSPRRWVLVGALLVAIAAAAVFRGVPIQDDEPTYLMQAATLARGRLMEPPVAPAERWQEPFTIFTDRGTSGKYLFGEPLALVPGVWLGVPIASHLVLVALTLVLVIRILHRQDSSVLAPVGVALLALSPEAVFSSATLVSQPTCLALIALALWATLRGGYGGGAVAGLSLGLALATRPQMALPCGLVILLLRVRDGRMLVGAALAGLPVLGAILAYDTAVTGHALVLPWDLFGVERYGFGRVLGPAVPYEHTPWKGLVQAGVAALRLNGWGLGWPVSWLGPAAWLCVGRPYAAAVRPWAWMALTTFLFQIGYYSVGTSDLGALYHYAAIPFMALSTAAVVEHLRHGERGRRLAVGVLAASMVLGTGSFLVEHGLRLRRLTDAIDAPYRALQVAPPALAFIETNPPETVPAGWLLSVKLHSRGEEEPIVYFPFGTPIGSYVRELAAGRSCAFVRRDPERGDYVGEPCQRLGAYLRSMQARYEAADRMARLPPGARWREAFPWLPWVGATPSR